MRDSGFFLDEERSPVREKLTEKHIVLCIAWPCRPISGGGRRRRLLLAAAQGYHHEMMNVYKFQQSSSAGLNAACVEAHKGDAGGAWK